MRIQHWSGYGCVNAKKVSEGKTMNNYGEIYNTISVRVEGDHECGLTPYWHDDTLIENWLFHRFYKGEGKFHGFSTIVTTRELCTFILEYEEA